MFRREGHVTALSAEPPSPRALAERRAADLLRELAGLAGGGTRLRVTACEGKLACLLQVWESSAAMPTARTEKAAAGTPKRVSGVREQCRSDLLAVVRAAGRPLTRKEVVRALKDVGAKHGPGTVAKALADLTSARELVNRRDKRGYRLPEWIKPQPTLFDKE
jgi:hypothetical protein